MGKVYGYLRCSTNEEKQHIGRQRRDVKKLANGKVDKYFEEYESGANTNRKELNTLLDILREGDCVVCTELSRISRSTKQLCEIIEITKEKKIKLIIGSFVVDCSKPMDAMTEGMLKMMGVFSEMERNMIKERVRSGIANAKENGKILGRRKTVVEDIPKKFLDCYPLYEKKKISKVDLAKLSNLSRPTVDKYIRLMLEIEDGYEDGEVVFESK